MGTREPKRYPCKIGPRTVLDVDGRCFPLGAIPSKGEREKPTEDKGTALGVFGKGKASSRELWFFPDLDRAAVRSQGSEGSVAAFGGNILPRAISSDRRLPAEIEKAPLNGVVARS